MGNLSAFAGPGQGRDRLIAADRRIQVRLEQTVSSKTARSGDRITGVVDEVVSSGSQMVLPKGSRLVGKVESVQSGDPAAHGWMRLVFEEVILPDGRRVRAQFSNLFAASDRHPIIRYVVPFVVGGGLGWLIGGKEARTSAVLGGLLGGSLIAFGGYRSVKDVELRAGRRISVRLGQDLQIPALE